MDSLEPQSEIKSSASTTTWTSFFELIKTVSFVLVVAFLIRHYLVQPFVVDGASMEPNFHHQEYILVDKLGYRLHTPSRGDVIVFHPPVSQDNFIKRIIGLPGETVTVKGHQIFVDGTLVEENYLPDRGQPDTPPTDYTVGSDEYFVMGDNRDHSKDSRVLGPIPAERIIGRAGLGRFPVKNLTVVATPTYPGLETSASTEALVRTAITQPF